MNRSSSGPLAVLIAGCMLAVTALAGAAQARDQDRDQNHDRDRHNTRSYVQNNRHYQYNRNYPYNRSDRNNRHGYSRRSSRQPFAYIGAVDQQRYGYAYGSAGRYRRPYRHHRHH